MLANVLWKQTDKLFLLLLLSKLSRGYGSLTLILVGPHLASLVSNIFENLPTNTANKQRQPTHSFHHVLWFVLALSLNELLSLCLVLLQTKTYPVLTTPDHGGRTTTAAHVA